MADQIQQMDILSQCLKKIIAGGAASRVASFSGKDGQDYIDVGKCFAGTLDLFGNLDVAERNRARNEVGDIAGIGYRDDRT